MDLTKAKEERRKRLAHMEEMFVEGKLLREIGDEYGLSRERVRQILKHSTNRVVLLRVARGHRETSDYKACSECKRLFGAQVKYTASGVCVTCIANKRNQERYAKEGRVSPQVRFILIRQTKECIECGKRFTKKNPYTAKLRHKACYQRYVYHSDPQHKLLQKASSMKWFAHRKNDPDYKAKIRTYYLEYYRRPEVIAHRKAYHHKLSLDPVYREKRRQYAREQYEKNKQDPLFYERKREQTRARYALHKMTT